MSSINSRTLIAIVLTAIFGAMLALLVRENGGVVLARVFGDGDRAAPDWTVIVALLGATAGVALLLLWTKQRRPLMITMVLILYVVLGWALTGPGYTLYTAVWVVSVLFLATEPLQALYGGSRFNTFVQHIRVWLAMNGSPAIVADGKTILPAGAGPHLGPRMVIVRPGNAVVMTLGSSVSRICGPSVFQSKKFEYVSQVLLLTKRRRSLTVPNALTSDQHPVDVHLSFVYGIGISDDTIDGHNASQNLTDGSRGLTAAEGRQLRQIVNLASDWELDVRAVIQGAAYNVISRYRYERLVTATSYQRLAREISDLAAGKVEELGGDLQSVAVASVAPRAEVIDAYTDGERIRRRRMAQGEGFRGAITAVAAGYSAALNLGMNLDDVHREAAHYMMEQMADDPATKILIGTPD